MKITYNRKKMEIVHFYVDNNNKTIDVWAKPDNVKNTKAEKLDVNKMELKKLNTTYEVQPTSDEVYQEQVDYLAQYPVKHIIEDNQKDDGKRENNFRKKQGLRTFKRS